uniref:ER membrane protein complex subunit 2 n=1 Tax=Strigamia maritima TaxID=126957 RepID=T1IPG5_STRMM
MATSLTWEGIRDLFRLWREENVRRGEEIVEKWESVLSSHINKLGDEKWVVYEQVCIAALDCNRIDVAQSCLKKLNKQFPGSLRVTKLRAMELEALENYEEAVKLYDLIIESDEANSIVRKRKVAILKAQNKIVEAVKELDDYLKKFMSDQEAWMELSELYIREQEYGKAAFCMEELILFNPHNHLYHQRYAEIRYTQGGFENMEIARGYFAQALKLNANNLRALFGFCLCSSNIAASPKSSAQKKKENVKFVMWAIKHITEKYQELFPGKKENPQIETLQATLNSLQIVPSN